MIGNGVPDDDSRRVGAAVALAALAAVVVLTGLLGLVFEDLLAELPLREILRTAGPVGPLLFVGLQAVQVVFAPIPGQLLAGVGGYVFGAPLGTLYSMAGVCLGSYIVFSLAREYGDGLVERLLDAETKATFERFGEENGVVTLAVFFLLPTFPDDALCAIAGLWDVRPRTFLGLLVLGRTPTFFAAAYAGTSLETGAFGRFVLVLSALAAVVLVVYCRRDWVERRLDPEEG
jgi:uncharacterized membrane protein YdjX (TVP38/TMEM64 family)